MLHVYCLHFLDLDLESGDSSQQANTDTKSH